MYAMWVRSQCLAVAMHTAHAYCTRLRVGMACLTPLPLPACLACSKGMEAHVTLHHFVHPAWFEKLGGFLKEGAPFCHFKRGQVEQLTCAAVS